ncbi:YigZ family protein [Flavivirga aquimarina]|uniref:YigZ family protein n=1 Tax=Flavivirga aquimarina TaxID=2027862 RepID=A0ABT8WAM7_9FLAO|nr:YigZ family protein [Flavivirga aquimarina]MDO5970206.1 YigZ family protein [Flavivirga aquimarina]
MTEKDTYKTIDIASKEVLFKDKNSKFFGYAFPVLNENDVKLYLEKLKKEHHSARHWCYAYQLGTETISYRANDDGEPSNSAGMPIYGQIQSFDVTNILIVVVRYFGGIKLGVSGLINAYKSTAQLALEHSNIKEKTINIDYLISFDYKNMNKVMRIIKEKNLKITNQVLEMDCNITISVRKKDASSVFEKFNHLFEVHIKKIIEKIPS